MSANSLSVPFPIFNDIDGDPLDAGYIYIGTANLDPVTNPISVYFDEALTIPASQPIRTINGFPSNSGSPARLYVNADDYSMTVRNKDSSFVYTSLTSTLKIPFSSVSGDVPIGRVSGDIPTSRLSGQLDASRVDFAQSGTGASTRTAESIFSDTVSVSDFGASGSPTDDSVAIQNAINHCIANSIEVLHFPSGEYIASGLTNTDQVKFVGDGAYFSDLTYRINGTICRNFTVPSGFSAMPFSTYGIDGSGKAYVDVDVEQLWLDNEVQGTVPYYVSWATGSDASSGTQPNAPLKTINAAIQKSNVGIIWLMDGVHYDGLDSYLPTRDVEIRSYSGNEVIIRMGEDPAAYTFTVTPSTAYTYETVISRRIFDVFDGTLVNANGEYRPLTERASTTEVNNNPGSWWYDTGTNKLYIRMPTNRAPGTDPVLLTTSQNIISGNQAIFLKNVKIEGGNHGFQCNATSSGTLVPRLYMQDCRIFYAQNFGIDSNGAKTYLERVEIFDSAGDNLNYHDQDGTACLALEIDVVSRNAGMRTQLTETNNASSMHEHGVVCRINGVYSDSYGPNIPDTDLCKSLNIGVVSKNPQCPTASQNVNFFGGSGLTGSTMYCHGCVSKGAVYDYSANTCDIFVADCIDQDTFYELDANSSVKQYWPTAK